MAYFSQDMKKVLVNRLKTNFPNWKFSVSVDHHSSVVVKIKSAPVDLVDGLIRDEDKKGFLRVNQYWLDSHFKGQALVELKRLLKDINLEGDKDANFDNSDINSDYFHVGYYVNLYIGVSSDKPFEFIPAKVKKLKTKIEV